MTNQIPAHIMNAMAINFDSVMTVSDEAVKNIFIKLKATGLKKFLSLSSQEIYPKEIQDRYANGFVDQNENITTTVSGLLLVIEEEFFCNLFQLPSDGLTNFAEVKASDLEEMQTLLSTDGRKIKSLHLFKIR